MAYTPSNKRVYLPSPVANINVAGTAETRGQQVNGELDITSYTNGGEVIGAADLGLNKVYNAVFWMSGNDTYAPRSFEVATDLKSGTLNVDTAGSGTEVSSTTAVGKLCFIAWGEMQGSGTN